MPDPAFVTVERLPAFDRDMKALKKRYRSLDEDLATLLRTALHAYHHLGIDTGHIVPIEGVQSGKQVVVCKVVRMACKSLKGTGSHSGMRVTYGYEQDRDRIVLVEIYFKGDKENEDRERIREFLRGEAGAPE